MRVTLDVEDATVVDLLRLTGESDDCVGLGRAVDQVVRELRQRGRLRAGLDRSLDLIGHSSRRQGAHRGPTAGSRSRDGDGR